MKENIVGCMLQRENNKQSKTVSKWNSRNGETERTFFMSLEMRILLDEMAIMRLRIQTENQRSGNWRATISSISSV